MSVLLRISESNFHQRDYVRIVLLFAFPLDEIKIRTARIIRELAANVRSCVVNRAFSCFLVQEHAGLSKQSIRPAPENPFFAVEFRKPCPGYFRVDIEMRS